MEQWKSHIPRSNPPKQFCERCFEQGDQKSQQNELELVLELVGDFFGSKKKCVVAGISVGEPPRGRGRAQGVGAPWTLMARYLLPLLCSQCEIYSNIPEKIIFKFQGIWRTFIFKVFFIALIIQKTDRKNTILLYLI